MVEACVAAASRYPYLLPNVELVAVPRGTWKYSDAGRLVADGIGAMGCRTLVSEVGVLQSLTVLKALRFVEQGEVDVAVVAGGETLDRRRQARKAGQMAPETVQSGRLPDVRIADGPGGYRDEQEAAWGIAEPYVQYALAESARRHRLGQTLAENRRQIATLYSRLSEVAAANPTAWDRSRWSVDAILNTTLRGNRMLSFPYSVKTVSQVHIDQAAAIVICSEEVAQRFGIPESAWIYPSVSVACSLAVPLVNRVDVGRNDQWLLVAEAIERELGAPVCSMDLFDLYSCFPVAVELQVEAFALPSDIVPSVTGGMSFGGGGFNHAALHALSRTVQLLQDGAGSTALVTANSGYLTKQGALVLTTTRPGTDLVHIDVTEAAREQVRSRPAIAGYSGHGVVDAATVLFDQNEPVRAIAIVRTKGGSATVASANDAHVVARFLETEPVTWAVTVADGVITALDSPDASTGPEQGRSS
jgi:acetyl-CoA C-acetyltransferase